MTDFSQQVYWYTRKEVQRRGALRGRVDADVVVVGGGMAGLSCAQKCLEGGRSVIVVEKDFCGSGASGRTSGFITPDSEIELSSLLSTYGPEEARRIWEFVVSGVDIIRRNITSRDIACDYLVQDSLFIANNKRGFEHVKEEHAARGALGYASALHDSADVRTVVGSSRYVGGVRYPGTFGINSFAYCQAMRDALMSEGAQIHEETLVKKIDNGVVYTALGEARAKNIIVCADRFIPDLGRFKKEIYHVQTFLGISAPLSDAHRAMIFPGSCVMVWDTDLVYNYFRVTGDNRLLVGGGDLLYTYARSLAGDTRRFRRRLTRYIRTKFPLVPIELEYVWPGMLGVSKDLLPVMGFDPGTNNIWYVGAATGLPWAAALGFYAAEKVLSGRDDFDERFSWKRSFVIGPRLQALLTTPPTYALSHGIAKYF